MNFETARIQMLTQQIRTWEVLDDRVLNVLHDTAREQFVPDGYQELAFADIAIPLGHAQSMMTPMVEGRLLQSLQIEPADEVLEIGTGSGYLTACLAKLALNVTSVDIFAEFVMSAGEKLARARIHNVDLETADANALSSPGQFDVIAVTASTPKLSEFFIDRLRPDGRLFIVVGHEPVMEARLIRKTAGGDWTQQSLFETVLAPLVNVDTSQAFVL